MNPNLLKVVITGTVFFWLCSTNASAQQAFTNHNALLYPDITGAVDIQATLESQSTANLTDNGNIIAIHDIIDVHSATETGNAVSSVTLGNSKFFTLPLTLIQFTISKNPNGKVDLMWKTAQEMNVSHFEIEKSIDGRKWAKIGTRPAKGQQGSVETYSYTDGSPVEDANYYRLRVVDYDFRADYSPVRMVTFGNETPVRVYPTLVKSNSTLFVEGISPEVAVIEMFSNDGNPVFKVKMYSNTFNLPVVQAGIYHLRITNTGSNTTVGLQKVVVY